MMKRIRKKLLMLMNTSLFSSDPDFDNDEKVNEEEYWLYLIPRDNE
jgi:hypothetical protein